MALSQEQLSTVFTKLSPILGEEVAEAVTQQFSTWNADDVVTKDFLRAELAEQLGGIRSEMSQQGWRIIGLMVTLHGLLAALVGLS